MQSVTKQTIKIYWDHAWRYRSVVLALLLMDTVTCALDIYLPFQVKHLLNSVDPATLRARQDALGYVWAILGLQLCNQTLWRLSGYANNFFQARVMSDLLNTCYEYILGHSYSFFTNNFGGSIVTKVRRYQNSFERLADVITWEIFRTILKTIFILCVLFYLRRVLGLMVLGWAIIYVGFSYLFTRWKLPYDIEKAEQDTRTTAHLADTIANSSNILMFSSQKVEVGAFHKITEKLYRLRRHTWNLSTNAEIFQALALVLLNFGLLYVSVALWQRGTLTGGDVALLWLYLFQIFDRLWDFGKNLRTIYECLADANEMTQMLMERHEVVDAPDAGKLRVKAGAITFDRVNFYYDSDTPILEKFSLQLAPGSKVALIGPSGGGKSTTIKLLFRFLDVQGGRILIDDQDIATVTQESLHKSISLVPQEPILFHRTLLENIRYGKPRATEADVIAAAKAAHAHEFISQFPAGYQTYVGERGVKLSGGERQRVAIARAILKNAPILVLDEATSSLDSESEAFIQDALKTLMKDKTTIVIAHRLSTIMKMDRIIVIEDGRITEEGKHAELLKAKQGTYQKLWEIQAGSFVTA